MSLPTWKKALFATIVTVGTLAGSEWAAHALWGTPPPFDVVIRVGQCRLHTTGAQTALDCTPPQRQPTMVTTVPSRPRVVLLGGSSVRLPWQSNMGHALQRLLPDVEVVNLSAEGMAAANVARLSQESAAIAPAVVVIYSGHNEYSGTVFYGRVQGTRLWMLPVYGLLSRSWIHALLTRAPRFVPRDMSVRPNTMLTTADTTALDLRSQIDARLRHDLAEAVKVSPAPVVISTLLRNPESPPTGILTVGLPNCEASLHRLRARSGPGLRQSLAAAEESCGEGAITWWLRSRIAVEEGRSADAEAALRRSLALDPLPLRAPAEADDMIREIAAETGASLVDLGAEVGLLPPAAWFTDPLHLSPEGAGAVAARLAPAVTAALGR